MKNTHFILLSFFLLSSCSRSEHKRIYEEIVLTASDDQVTLRQSDPHAELGISPQMRFPPGQGNQDVQVVLDSSVARPSLSWTIPEGWNEQKGEGMRLATFSLQEQQGPFQCTIVSLKGTAGGIRANVLRWLGQVNISIPTSDQLGAFLDKQKEIISQGGLSVKIIDFTQLQSGNDDHVPSMMAGVVSLEGITIFVKMTANKGTILNNQYKFRALCASLELKK